MNETRYRAGFIKIKETDTGFLWKCHKCQIEGNDIVALKDVHGVICYVIRCNCQLIKYAMKEHCFFVPYKYREKFNIIKGYKE